MSEDAGRGKYCPRSTRGRALRTVSIFRWSKRRNRVPFLADLWSSAALIDTGNFTTLISPWASISDFNLDRPSGSTWRPGDKNYWRLCNSLEFFRPPISLPLPGKTIFPAGNFHFGNMHKCNANMLKFYKMSATMDSFPE